MAVDFMRQESTRARLQSTLDRSILAAADMDQKQDPEAVVRDYFAKSGVKGYTLNVHVANGYDSRRVSAVTSGEIDSYFLKFLGIASLDAPAAGAAEESISNIEISLVLDVSGSMGETSASGKKKLDELKTAAKAFVDTIYAQTDPNRTTISIVPYSTQVNAGEELASKFSISKEQTVSACVDFTPEDYTKVALTTTEPLSRTAHFDPISGRSTKTPRRFVCRTEDSVKVMPVESNPAILKAKIDSLVADGYTSIEIGMKWGAALLEPEARPAIAALAADGVLPASVASRPLDNNAAETLKVIVVMTDGINTNQWLMADSYKSGLSQVWVNPDNGKLSYKGLLGFWVVGSGWKLQPDGGSDAVQLTYPELWATTGVKYNASKTADMMQSGSGVAWNLTYNLWTAGTWVSGLFHPGVYTMIGGSEKDARTDTICTAAKSAGIKIYSIGFEVTDDSAKVLEKCATTKSHFFRVNGLQIHDAFQSIANDIGKLRLTQ
ncbi:hypothetical protein [Frigidibacter sp. ROC022]|uniref:hypothetical protein n=1 Tax=Frigidibacter sp. ROC022 TaxID=2971796 RepID=UPI003FCDD64B